MECISAPLPVGPEWAYEVKWDGYRAMGSAEWLLSRQAKRMDFPTIQDALHLLGPGTMLDGEVVALDEAGRPSFNRLQNYREGHPVLYYAFDILSYRGKSLLKMPWKDRRTLLERAVPSHPSLQSKRHLQAALTGCG